MNEKPVTRWPRLLLGTFALLFAGIIYAWSILKAPLASEFGWTPADLAFNFTLTLCFFAFGGLVSGLISTKTSPKLRMLVSAVLIFAGFMISSRLSGQSLAPLYLAYGGMGGLGIGIAYNTIISVTNAWFPDKKGMCAGVMMMGFGFSTLILGKIAGAMIEVPALGWRTTYMLLAVVTGVVLLLTALLIKYPPAGFAPAAPAKSAAAPAKPENHGSVVTGQATVPAEKKDFSALEMIKRASFWKLFFFFIFLSAVGSTAISFAKDYFVTVGATSNLAITMVGIISVCNGLGRLCSGWLQDTFGIRKTQFLTCGILLAAPTISLLALFADSLILGILGLCLCGFSYGFSPTLTVGFAQAFFGPKHFPLNFSILCLVLIPASFTSTLAGKLVTVTGSYTTSFLVLIAFAVIALIDSIAIRKA